MFKELTSASMAGLLASGLFLIVFGIGLGFFFMFLPTLPLFFLGLHKQPGLTHVAAFIASVIIGIVAGWSAALLFLLFLGLPTWYMARESLLSKTGSNGQSQEWFPVGTMVMHLALYACTFAALMTFYYSLNHVSVPQMLSQNIHEAFSDLEGDYGDVIDTMADNWSFLMFPITIWLWSIILYIHAWMANRALIRRGMQRRPDFIVRLFAIPSWMFSLLAICALASLIGSESMRFLGKTTLLSLMLPYFFLGITLVHTSSQSWPNQRFFLFFVYFLIITQFWPALILAGIGMWHQVKTLRINHYK